MSYSWDFSKIPDEVINTVIELIDSNDAGMLMKIHNDYRLSYELYCCSHQNEFIIKWFKYGIETGQIKRKNS